MPGAVKVWKQLLREGIEVARCTLEWLMRRAGLHGIRRVQVVRTTAAGDKAMGRRIGCSASSLLTAQMWVKADFVLDALEQAPYACQPLRTGALIHQMTGAASTARPATQSD